MKSGFTLLEVVIVIIIIGVLASLALPKMFKMVEASRAAEAIAFIATIRGGMERFYLMNNGSYQPPGLGATSDLTILGLENPGLSPGAHFNYDVSFGTNGYVVSAQRNTVDGGVAGRYIIMGYNVIPGMCTNHWCGNTSGIFWAAHDPYAAVIPSDGRPRSEQKL